MVKTRVVSEYVYICRASDAKEATEIDLMRRQYLSEDYKSSESIVSAVRLVSAQEAHDASPAVSAVTHHE